MLSVPLWTRFNKEIVQSTVRPGFFDHTVNAVTWLTHFKAVNSDLINKLGVGAKVVFKQSFLSADEVSFHSDTQVVSYYC
jgi:hypothetical protein